MKFVRTIAFVLWVAVTALDLYIELDPRFVVNVPVKLGFAAAFVALWSIVFPPTRRHMGKWLAVLFVYYVWMLLNILFFDNAFGREQMHYASILNLSTPSATMSAPTIGAISPRSP